MNERNVNRWLRWLRNTVIFIPLVRKLPFLFFCIHSDRFINTYIHTYVHTYSPSPIYIHVSSERYAHYEVERVSHPHHIPRLVSRQPGRILATTYYIHTYRTLLNKDTKIKRVSESRYIHGPRLSRNFPYLLRQPALRWRTRVGPWPPSPWDTVPAIHRDWYPARPVYVASEPNSLADEIFQSLALIPGWCRISFDPVSYCVPAKNAFIWSFIKREELTLSLPILLPLILPPLIVITTQEKFRYLYASVQPSDRSGGGLLEAVVVWIHAAHHVVQLHDDIGPDLVLALDALLRSQLWRNKTSFQWLALSMSLPHIAELTIISFPSTGELNLTPSSVIWAN